jgi:hypothetical protein|tara:strand:+ start:8690 stop:9112 length:423 start_codon:yes stop_codon:yes gene_type:complete
MMDTFTRRYVMLLLALLAAVAVAWLLNRDGRVADINQRLAADPELAAYPYQFTVQEINNGVAFVSSPRSAQVPVMRFLHSAFPALQDKDVQHPDMMAAQDRLVAVQSRAAELVQTHPEVNAVRWVLDERWFAERGINVAP